jgi:hypothetical protein
MVVTPEELDLASPAYREETARNAGVIARSVSFKPVRDFLKALFRLHS